jgi:hypothetical protein
MEVDMQRDQVISILESLAEGQPQFVVEALTTATNLLRGNERPASAGARWMPEEDAISAPSRRRRGDPQIAQKTTVRAITIRL